MGQSSHFHTILPFLHFVLRKKVETGSMTQSEADEVYKDTVRRCDEQWAEYTKDWPVD